jgi:1,4-alpha-glucan branching enzyme
LAADPWLQPYLPVIERRRQRLAKVKARLTGDRQTLADFASGHEYFGLHFQDGRWIFREWAPKATAIFLVGDFSDWKERPEYALQRLAGPAGVWEAGLPESLLSHGMLYRLRVHWHGGSGDRLPAWGRRVVQDPQSLIFSAQVWRPQPYVWKVAAPVMPAGAPLIYEAHIGMGQEREGVGTFREFRENILPKIVAGGYNTIQLMAVLEHPYYGSFGYHVSSFFAVSSRFGTPEEFKELVDAAHGLGLRVIIDLIHSHAVKNEIEGLGRFDGSRHQYFHEGLRGYHTGWDSYLFDYAKPEVIHFLLSNCRFWLDEYRIDGFRFDGITSMLYHHHGLNHAFGGYDEYFGTAVDEDALTYLALANQVVHAVRPDAITVAEDVSGMPGLGAPPDAGGSGFDYRMAMGVTDYWYKLMDIPDEKWDMATLWHELVNRRQDEKTISYVECHDQAIVGGKTVLFRLLDREIYEAMHQGSRSLTIDRGIALHKLFRLATLVTAGHGYLNFMGNEFGHPEWIDFPREGNGWSYRHARRLWSLAEDPGLRYHGLRDFDRKLLGFARETNLIAGAMQQAVHISGRDRIISCERNGFWFFLNFNTQQSFADHPVEVLPGRYEWVFDSDEPGFGGLGRIVPNQVHEPRPVLENGTVRHLLHLYLPSATGLVLRRIWE